MKRWIGSLLLHTVIFLMTWLLIYRCISATYFLSLKAGAQFSENLPGQHFLVVSLLSGLLAGLFGGRLLRALLLLAHSNEEQPSAISTWKRPQVWVFLLFTIYFGRVFLGWILQHRSDSVLAAHSSLNLGSAVFAFFGNGCPAWPALTAANLNELLSTTCSDQIIYTMPWIAAVGYSLAGLIPREFWTRITRREQPAEADKIPDEAVNENKI